MPSQRKALRLHVDAQAELQEAVSFYRERGGSRLAEGFKHHIAQAFTTIATTPDSFPPDRELPGVQKFRLKHFPFSILYLNLADYIWIVAVANGRRRPGYWKARSV